MSNPHKLKAAYKKNKINKQNLRIKTFNKIRHKCNCH